MEKSQSLFIVDVRNKEEVDRGCIPGSIHVPGEVKSREMTLTSVGTSYKALFIPEFRM